MKSLQSAATKAAGPGQAAPTPAQTAPSNAALAQEVAAPAGGQEPTPLLDAAQGAGGLAEAEAAVEEPFAFQAGAEQHHLWVDMSTGEPVPWVASTPSRLQDFVANLSQPQRDRVTQTQGYAGQLDTITAGAGAMRDLAASAFTILTQAPAGRGPAIQALDQGAQGVMQALCFVFDALGPPGKKDLGLGLLRGRHDDVQRRLERCLDAAGHNQQSKGAIAWIRETAETLKPIRDLLRTSPTQEQARQARDQIAAAEETTALIEDSLGDALAARDAVDQEYQAAEKPAWRTKLNEVSTILERARAQVTAAIPFGRVRFRGSLATGWKGPHKVNDDGSARRMDTGKFDADAFVELQNEDWAAMVQAGLVKEGDLYAKVPTLDGWEHQALLIRLEEEIGADLEQVAGYQHEDTGELHFDFTVQPTSSSWKNLEEGLAYPKDAFRKAGAAGLQDALPDRPNSADDKRTRAPGIFRGE